MDSNFSGFQQGPHKTKATQPLLQNPEANGLQTWINDIRVPYGVVPTRPDTSDLSNINPKYIIYRRILH